MANLSKERFEKARDFIKSNGRGLEQAIFEYEFESGSQEDVLNELAKFQNEDGGFGNALEPDFRCVASSAIATSIGLKILSQVKVDAQNEIVQKAINYLIDTFEENSMGWKQVPREVESAPRSPWWNYKETREDWGNPNAELLGFFYEYHSLVPEQLIRDIEKVATEHLHDLTEYEFHELLSYLRLEERMPKQEAESISKKLNEIVLECVEINPEKWQSYCLQPIQVVTSPASRYYRLFSDVIPTNLDYLLEKQLEDGSWEPTWTWGQYENVWKRAKVEWQGVLTLDYLLLFKAFDRIEK